MTEDTPGLIALQGQITRLSTRLSLIENRAGIPAEEPANLKDLQVALAKKSHVIAKQDEKIKNLRNRLDEKDRNNENLAKKLTEAKKAAEQARDDRDTAVANMRRAQTSEWNARRELIEVQRHLDQVRSAAGTPARPPRRLR